MATSTTALEFWAFYPMGPKLYNYLGFQTPQEQNSNTITPEDQQNFEAFFLTFMRTKPAANLKELVEVIEELVQMKLATAALSFAKDNEILGPEEDFRAQLALGSAAMLLQEVKTAEHHLRLAHQLAPEELAPYINLAEVFYFEQRDDECLEWALAGLNLDVNSARLWEKIGGVFATRYDDKCGPELMTVAKQKSSWAGMSLAAQYTAPDDPLLRAEVLQDLYQEGLRDLGFISELTAALGVASQYEKIPPILWSLEKLASPGAPKIPWEIYAHSAQAYLGLEKTAQAAELLQKAMKDRSMPESARGELTNLLKEIGENTHV